MAEADRTRGIIERNMTDAQLRELAEGVVLPDGIHNIKFVDFAGQVDYATTHQLFMSSRVVCMLVVDLPAYEPVQFKDDAQRWIEMLETRVGGQLSVLVVCTKVPDAQDVSEKRRDLFQQLHTFAEHRTAGILHQLEEATRAHNGSPSAELLRLEWLAKTRPLMPGSEENLVCVDSASLSGFDTLVHQLAEAIKPAVPPVVPKYFMALRCVLERKAVSNPMLTMAELSQLVQCELPQYHLARSPGLLGCVVSYLHRMGVVRWFNENPMLTEIVFLNMQWLGNALCAIVGHDLLKPKFERIPGGLTTSQQLDGDWEYFKRSARLSRGLLRHLWHGKVLVGGEALSDAQFDSLCTVLQHVGVCFEEARNNDRHLVVAAALTPVADSDTVQTLWHDALRGSSRVYKIEVDVHLLGCMPAGLFDRVLTHVMNRFCHARKRAFSARELAVNCGKTAFFISRRDFQYPDTLPGLSIQVALLHNDADGIADDLLRKLLAVSDQEQLQPIVNQVFF